MPILAQQNPNGDMRWLLQDGLQSVRGVSDGVSMLSAQAYSPYGEPLFADLPTEFGFTGEQTDPLNDLVYLRARFMNPKLGIFGSLDPFEGESSSPLTMNGYGWVEGNVANRVDPRGLSSGTCQGGMGQTSSPLSPTPPNTEPIDVFFGGSLGCNNRYLLTYGTDCPIEFRGPPPEGQTPIWYQNSDIRIQWRGVPKTGDEDYYIYPLPIDSVPKFALSLIPSLDLLRKPRYQLNGELLGGKRLQAYQGEQGIMRQENWQNRDITLTGYSAGGDTVIPFLDESVERLREAGWEGNVTHVVVLGGTLTGGLRAGRNVGGEFQNIVSQAQLEGTHFYIWDDAAGEPVSWTQYQQPNGALGNYTYQNSPMIHWDQFGTTGTNNNPTLWQDVQNWRMTHPYVNRNTR